MSKHIIKKKANKIKNSKNYKDIQFKKTIKNAQDT